MSNLSEPRYRIRRGLTLLYAAGFVGIQAVIAADDFPRQFEWRDVVSFAVSLPAAFATAAYAIGFRPRRGAWFWSLFPWAMLAWFVGNTYLTSFVHPTTLDDVEQAIWILAKFLLWLPGIHLAFRFRAVGRLPVGIDGDAYEPYDLARWCGLRSARDVWTAVLHARWFQFSFRTPLVLLTLWCAWLGMKVEQLRAKRNAYETLIEAEWRIKVADASDREAWVEDLLPELMLREPIEASSDYSYITELELAHCLRFRHLKSLDIVGESDALSDANLRGVAGLSDLRDFRIHYFGTLDQSLAALRDHPSLQRLLVWCEEVTPAAVEAICENNLVELELTSFNLSDAGAASIGGCESIQRLDIHGGTITDDGLAHLAALPKLSDLHLSGLDITGEGFRGLHDQASLKTVSVGLCPIQDDCLRYFPTLPSLSTLKLNKVALRGSGFRHFSNQSPYFALDIQDTAIDEDGLAAIASVPTLWRLSLVNCGITGEGFWKATPPQDCSYIELDRNPISDSGFAAIVSRLTGPTSLSVSKTTISDVALLIVPPNQNLVALDLTDTCISDLSVGQLAKFERLSSLRLDRTLVTALALPDIQRIKSLEVIKLDEMPLWNVDPVALKSQLGIEVIREFWVE